MSHDGRALDDAAAAALGTASGIVSAYLFGSTAENRAHRDSDVDVGILLDRAVWPTPADRFEVRLRLAAALEHALGVTVDAVIINDVPPQFARRVMTAGRRIVLRHPEADHAFLRTTLSRAADLEPFLRRMRRVALATVTR